MFEWFKRIFNINNPEVLPTTDNISVLTLEEIKEHFKNMAGLTTTEGFKERTEIISEIIASISPDKKNIFILDDVVEITDILKEELRTQLEKAGKLDKVNIIGMSSKLVGFDMLSILANHDEINIDYIITDITFGGNEKINGNKLILDGIDILIITKSKFDNLLYLIFTGNILSETNVKNYNFAKKYEKYIGKNILDNVIIKDSAINLNSQDSLIFDIIIRDL